VGTSLRTLPRLYAIADKGTLDARGVSVAAFAGELREAGVRLVQYRDKVGSPQEVLRVAAEITAVFAGVEAALVLNDRADLAVLAGWGVHVGQGDLPVGDARKLVLSTPTLAKMELSRRWGTRACYVVGVSTHTEAQVMEADKSEADYVAVGPVFATSTKANAEPVVGLEGVRRARALTKKPLVAIGGITRENARSAIDSGADSVAVISAMFVPGRRVGDVARDFLEILR
jgi:thiamine-phosphate pyrophosphorylase